MGLEARALARPDGVWQPDGLDCAVEIGLEA